MLPDFSIRTLVIFIMYGIMIVASFFSAYLLRFDFNFKILGEYNPIGFLFVVLAVKYFYVLIFGQFKGLMTFFHIPDVIKIFWVMMFSAVTLLALNYFLFFNAGVPIIPRGVILSDMLLSMVIFGSARIVMRMYRERSMVEKGATHSPKRVMIIGAGDIGTSLAADLIARKNLGILPVLFLDDDPQKWGKQIMGIEVAPLEGNMSNFVSGFKIDRAIIASVRFSGQRISKIISALHKIGIETSIVPSYHDLASGRVKASLLRDVDIEDVLGREPVKLDDLAIDKMIQGKIVMVTEADTIREQLLAYVDRESEASLRLDKASALPCGSEEERTEREREIQAATRNAALVALRVAYEVGTVMETIIYVAHKGYQPALPEACVAMMSARTCVFAALLRVETYLLSIRDEAFVARTREEVEKLKENTARVERKLADWMSMRI